MAIIAGMALSAGMALIKAGFPVMRTDAIRFPRLMRTDAKHCVKHGQQAIRVHCGRLIDATASVKQ